MSLNVFSRRIPSTYQELRYLGVNSGEPYIDLGITGNRYTKAEVTFSSVETLAMCMFGYQANAVGITFNLSQKSNNTRFGAWSKVGFGFELFDGQKHVLEISQQGLYQDGTLVATPTSQTFTTGNLTLFKAEGAVTYGNKTIYGCRVWNNGTLQRDMVPCKRLSDNTLGMYDLVSDQFFTNAASNSSFSAGLDSIGHIEKLQATILEPIFPPEYEQLEYLQSSGTQYIDTNVKLTSDDIVKCKFESLSRPDDNNFQDGIYGTMETQEGTDLFFMLSLSELSDMAIVGTRSNATGTHVIHLNNIYSTTLSNGTYIENRSTYTFTKHDGFIFSTNCYLFKKNPSQLLVSAKVYSFEIVNKFNGIPCRRRSDNVLGFYDTISKTFFTNAGTGTFIAGPSLELPSAYQKVEYIESSGTQYIDTGVITSDNKGIDLNYAYTVNSSSTPSGMCGVLQPTEPRTDALLITTASGYTNTSIRLIDRGATLNLGEYPTRYERFSARINWVNDGKLNFNNGVITMSVGSNSVYTSQLRLFSIYDASNDTYNYTSARIYSCGISEGDTIIRKFIPCYRKSDNEVGLYDTVNNVFYTNQGTGEFTAGPSIAVYKAIKLRLNVLKSLRVPSEYQEVQYVESSGTQYIDTGIKLSSSDTVKCKFEITAKPTDYSYREGIYGTMQQISGNNTFFVLLMRTPTLARVGTSSNQVTSTNVELNTVYDTTLSNGTYIQNGTTYTFTPHNGFTFSTNCYIFARNQSAMLPTSAKVYSFEIVGKFNGIPCYRKSDNVVGFYDTISETFYTNAGTGNFVAGPVSNNMIRI